MFRNLMIAAMTALSLGLAACAPAAAADQSTPVCETGMDHAMIQKALKKGVKVEVSFAGDLAKSFLAVLGMKGPQATLVEILVAGDAPVKRVVGYLNDGCMEDYIDLPADIVDEAVRETKAGV